MRFARLARIYIKIFYLLGQCPLLDYLPPFDKDIKSTVYFKSKLPLIVLSVINLSLCGLGIVMLFKQDDLDQSTKTLMLFFFLCQIFRIIVVVYQGLFYTNYLDDVNQIFHSVENFFENNLNSPISYQLFRRKLRIKFILALCAYAQEGFFLFVVITALNTINWINVIMRYLVFSTIVSVFHVVFYADLLSFNIQHLNSIVVRDIEKFAENSMNVFIVSEQKHEKNVYENLMKYKFVHYRLWQATKLINAYCGLSIIALLSRGFVDIIFCSYWQIRTLQMEFTLLTFGKIIFQ